MKDKLKKNGDFGFELEFEFEIGSCTSFSSFESLWINKFPANELIRNGKSVDDNSTIFEHGFDIFDFFILEEIREYLLADKLVRHDSENFTKEFDFSRVSINMFEETFEFSDRNNFVFFIFDSLEELFDHFEITKKSQKTFLVLFKIPKYGFGIVFGDIFGVLVRFFGVVSLFSDGFIS